MKLDICLTDFKSCIDSDRVKLQTLFILLNSLIIPLFLEKLITFLKYLIIFISSGPM